MAKIAVLILNYNGNNVLNNAIQSVLTQKGIDFKIFIIDNGSTDDSMKSIGKDFPGVKIIQIKKNLGFGGGINMGIKHVINKFEIIVCLDNDIILEKGFLVNLVNTFAINEKIGIVSAVLLDWPGKKVVSIGGYFSNFITGTVLGYYVNFVKKSILKIEPFPIFFAMGGSMAIKSEVLKKIGYFDESFFIYFEDVDLSWRALINDYLIYGCPQATLRHLGSGSASKIKYIAGFYLEKNRMLIYFKNLSLVFFIIIFPFLLLSRFTINTYYFFLNRDIKLLAYRIVGILSILFIVPTYWEERKRIQKKRTVSDIKILRRNNIGFNFNFKQLYFLMHSG